MRCKSVPKTQNLNCKKTTATTKNKGTSDHLINTEVVARKFSVKKCIHIYFRKFKEKHLRPSLFFNRVASLRPATLLERNSDDKKMSKKGCPIQLEANSLVFYKKH